MNFDADKLEEILGNAVSEYRIPGLSIAIERDGQNIFSLGLGVANTTDDIGTTSNTIFGTASLTKMLTTLILLKAEEMELLMLTDKLSLYYPDLKKLDTSHVSIKNLLNHTAGLPGLPTRHRATDLNKPSINPGMKCVNNFVKYLNDIEFSVLDKPGRLLSYSNEGYCLLGGIIERVFDKSFEKVAEQLVLKPLKMNHSFIGNDRCGRFKEVAEPIIYWENNLKTSKTEYWDSPLFYPAGGLMSSAKDILKLSSALFGESNFLKYDQFKQVTLDPIPVASRHKRCFAYGLGTEIEYIDSQRTLLWHTGQRPGISSFVGHLVQDRLSVALLTNISDAPASKIGRLVFSYLFCNYKNSVNLNWLQTTTNTNINERDYERLVGTYGSSEVGTYYIHLIGKKLLMKFVYSENEMIFHEDFSGIVGSQTFKFILKEKGDIYALALDLRILPRLS